MTLDSNGLPCVVSVSYSNYTTPSGYTASGTCSLVLQQGGYVFVPYSHMTDNMYTVVIRCFDCNGDVEKDTSLSGARYLTSVSINLTTGLITYTGQSSATVTVYWSALMMN